jgi:DNA helicase-2/ATP-dependent DNA helicase PcrA
MTDVLKIDGSPGGGKTHTLRQKLRAEKRDGADVNDFWWLNFTNSGREDVQEDLPEIFPDADASDATRRAKTIHGLSLSLCIRDGLISHESIEDVIIEQGGADSGAVDPYAEFCQERGIPYDADAADPRALLSGEQDTERPGNKLFAVNDYLRQTCRPPDAAHEAPIDTRQSAEALARLLRAWKDYKRHRFDNRRFEHGDYLREAINRGLAPSTPVLLIDEFQDLAPLEYKLYKQWRDSTAVERVYVAGDPNQSIYSFRGGDPVYFEETDVDETVTLKESYRCPREVAQVGHDILQAHHATDPRGFTGRTDGGCVEWPSLRERGALRDRLIADARAQDTEPSVFLLTRTNYQLSRLAGDLRKIGIPFEMLGARGGLWDGHLGDLKRVLERYRDGEDAFTRQYVSKLLNLLPDTKDRRSEIVAAGPSISQDSLAAALDGEPPLEVVSQLSVRSWERDALANALDAPPGVTPSDIQLGTIHAAKGLEAPTVYLFANTSQETVKRYNRDDALAAEEHRAYYVGATRASEALYIVDGYFDGPTAPPLERVRAVVGGVA